MLPLMRGWLADGSILGQFVVVLADELDLPLMPGGSTTMRRRKRQKGIESDECYWIANAHRMAGVRRLNLRTNPPPDLAIEVDVSHSSMNRMGIYAALQVPEVWRLDGDILTFHVLDEHGAYQSAAFSRSFPQLAPADLMRFLQEARQGGDQIPLMRRFRAWVRERLLKRRHRRALDYLHEQTGWRKHMSTVAPPQIVLGPGLAGIFLTPEEFDAIEEVDRDYRYELINGRLIVTPPPLEAERGPNEELGRRMLNYRDFHPQGSALDDTLPGASRCPPRQPPARRIGVIWAGLGRQPDPRGDLPTIVVEWVSESKRDWQRDYVEKAEEYRALRIAEYWIFDRFRRTLTVCRGTPQAPEEQVVREGEIYRTPLLPGFELPLAELLAVADRWQ